jgi:glycosyltransferase involved in cell wall biosynthesis
MNILYVMLYWPVYGGGETVTASLTNELVKRGHNVFVAYSYYNKIEPMPYFIDDRINSINIVTHDNYNKEDVSNLRNIIISNKIDIMIIQWACTQLCYEAKKNTSCKLIKCWHMDVFQKEPLIGTNLKLKIKRQFLPLYRKYEIFKQIKKHNYFYKICDKYVFLSNTFVDKYKKISRNHNSKNKLISIPNPLTYDSFYNIDKYDEKEKIVLYVGRMYEYPKRLSYILRIWKEIIKDAQFDEWKLIMVGEGPDLDKTMQLSKEMNLCNILFEGFQNPYGYYLKSSVFVMTSSYEGFGMSIVEAQQCGVVPLVMDTYTSLHDIITDKYNGLIVKDNDFDFYIDSLKQLMLDNDYRKYLAKNALISSERFNINSITDKWEQLFKELYN